MQVCAGVKEVAPLEGVSRNLPSEDMPASSATMTASPQTCLSGCSEAEGAKDAVIGA